MHDEERRARLACVDALQALRDGVGAARGVEGVTGPELETLDGVCRRTLASLPTREHLLQDRAPGVLKPSALLRVRMAAAALDKVMDATLEEPFARPGALNHARRAAHRLEDADYDAYSTWHAPLANALDAACALLDRHASSSSTSLDVVRLMKRRRRAPEDEHPCSTDEALDEWGRRLDAGKVPDARQWRVVATLSNEDAPEETQEDNWGGSWDERPWTSDPEEIGPVKKDLDLVKAKAELTQRTCLRLDAALEEVVAQMRGGFASKADLQEVEEHLRRLASIQRGTANEIASNKAGLSDYELQLKRVADQVRASQAKTPRFQRLEQCVLRRPLSNTGLGPPSEPSAPWPLGPAIGPPSALWSSMSAPTITPSPRRRLISRKADAEAVARVTTEIRGRVDGVESKAAEFVVPEPIGAAADGIFSTKCLACNRPYQYPQKQEIPEVPRQRSLGVMPPVVDRGPRRGRDAGARSIEGRSAFRRLLDGYEPTTSRWPWRRPTCSWRCSNGNRGRSRRS